MSYAISRAPVKADDALIPLAPLGLTPDVLERAAARHAERARGLPKGSLVDAVKARQAAGETSETDTISDNSPTSRGYSKSSSHSQAHTLGRRQADGVRAARKAKQKWSGVVNEVSAATFAHLLPAKPYCTDASGHRLIVRKQALALDFKLVQINHLSSRIVALVVDIDRQDASTAWIDADLPQPSFIVVNPENGHAHMAWVFRTPVLAFDKSASKPQKFFEAIERGFIRRLKADPGYSGMMMKNPLHPHWRTIWGPTRPYTLAELDAPLDFEDKAPVARVSLEMGFGRNSTVFETVRQIAYRRCVAYKVDGGSIDGWRGRLLSECESVNREFARPLSGNELGHIAKSIARWTWRNMNLGGLADRQRQRAKRRWADHTKVEPWKAMNLSRATYFRRKKAGTLPATTSE